MLPELVEGGNRQVLPVFWRFCPIAKTVGERQRPSGQAMREQQRDSGAKPPENRQNLPVDALHQLWQDGAGMNESEKQFSFTRAASSTSGRAEKEILISWALALDPTHQLVNRKYVFQE